MSGRRVSGRRPPWLAERLEYVAFRVGVGIVSPFGRRSAGAVFGWIARNLGPLLPLSARAEQGLRLIRPEMPAPERRRVIRGVLDNFSRLLVEYRHLPELAEEAKTFRVEGLEHYLTAREASGGRVVLASAHIGNWEALRAVVALHGPGPAIIYRAFNNRLVDDGCQRFLMSTGWPAFTKGSEGARDLYKHVRGGGAALILVDQRLGGAPILDFMGHPAETSLAAAQMAKKLGAPLIAACARRDGDGFVVRFEPPAPEGSPVDMMQYVNDRIGDWVKETPEQWFWLHRRWRIRNVGERGRKFDAERENGAG